MNAATNPLPTREVEVEVPKKLGFLFELHRYKIVYGGRGSAKSWSFADALLFLGAHQKLLILCAREIQKSIKDSVHRLLKERIEALDIGSFYEVLDTTIRGSNGTEFIFAGLQGHTVESIKSFEGVDIVWVEEGQTVSETSWKILIPTIRAPNSEIWVSFNPDMESDATWQRFVVKRPTGAVVCKMNYTDNKWFPRELEQERKDCLRDYPEDYPNIWLGENRVTVAGAIYAREVQQMIEERRYAPLPYDPRLPVHTVWDLGWNDAMSIIFFQKTTPVTVNIINYMEDSFKRYDEYAHDMRLLRYNYGQHWLPHDGNHANPQTGKTPRQVLKPLLGKLPRVVPKSDPNQRVRAGRLLFPRIYVDSTERQRDTGYLGAQRLVECLKRYRRNVPKSTEEPSTPVHDEYSHGADAFGALAEIVDQVRNEDDEIMDPLPGYRNADAGMGMLG